MMTFEEAREKLHPYFDGELPSEERAALEAVLEREAGLRDELAELAAAQSLMNEAFDPALAGVNFDSFTDDVMDAIARESAAPERVETHWLDRLASALGLEGWLSPPLAGAMALAALLAVGFWFMPEPTMAPESGAVATGTPGPPSTGRRSMETEAIPAGRNAATVVSWEAANGRVEIAENTDDPDQPMVVWHIEEEVQAPGPDAGI